MLFGCRLPNILRLKDVENTHRIYVRALFTTIDVDMNVFNNINYLLLYVTINYRYKMYKCK